MADLPQRLNQEEFQKNTLRLDNLVKEFEALPYPEIQEKVFELLNRIDLLHREALNRLVEFLEKAGQGPLVEKAVADPSIKTLLQLYDLAPTSPQEQVITSLEDLGDIMSGLGCLVELFGVEEGIVHLRLSGACQENPDIDRVARRTLEASIQESYPGFRQVEYLDPLPLPAPPAARSIIPLDVLRRTSRKLKRPVFTEVASLEALPQTGLLAVEAEGLRVLVCQVEGEIYAYHNTCPGSPLPLDMGSLEGYKLLCPWHQCLYDVRSGKRLDGGTGKLVAVPASIINGMIQLALKTSSEE